MNVNKKNINTKHKLSKNEIFKINHFIEYIIQNTHIVFHKKCGKLCG